MLWNGVLKNFPRFRPLGKQRVKIINYQNVIISKSSQHITPLNSIFSPSQPFLIEGVLASTNLFSKS